MTQFSDHIDSDVETFKVLSIDGGGIKGLYSARILENFEKQFKCSIADYFDLICGTSTGGLIALGLSLKIPVSVISNLYYERGKRIFPQHNNLFRNFKQLVFGSKYNNQELKTALQEIFGHRTLGESSCLLCIPAFSLTDGRPHIFKYDHPEGKLRRDNGTKYVDIALATSAAPAYLPIVTINNHDSKQFVDGGIYANNPTLVGVLEALRYFVGENKKFQRLMVMSIGSLEPTPGRLYANKHNRSIIDWNKDLISIFFEGQAGLTNYFVEVLSQHCDSPFVYVRIPGPPLSSKHEKIINLDNTSNDALNLISKYGNDQGLVWEKIRQVEQFFESRKNYTIQ